VRLGKYNVVARRCRSMRPLYLFLSGQYGILGDRTRWFCVGLPYLFVEVYWTVRT